MSNFQPLVVVDRGSETQPRVVENLNKFSQQDKGLKMKCDINQQNLKNVDLHLAKS